MHREERREMGFAGNIQHEGEISKGRETCLISFCGDPMLSRPIISL